MKVQYLSFHFSTHNFIINLFSVFSCQYFLDAEDVSASESGGETNRPRTTTQMSEVHLTDGTILRQTYFGTAPQSVSPYPSTEHGSTSSTKGIKNEKATKPLLAPQKTSTSASSTNGIPHQGSDVRTTGSVTEKTNAIVCSPYQVVEKPTHFPALQEEGAGKISSKLQLTGGEKSKRPSGWFCFS